MVKQFCLQHLSQLSWSDSQLYCLNLALAEGFTNAIRHAHRVNRLEIRIWAQGNPFAPDALAEPKPGTLQEGGYSWFLLRRLADQVIYERGVDERNLLVIKRG